MASKDNIFATYILKYKNNEYFGYPDNDEKLVPKIKYTTSSTNMICVLYDIRDCYKDRNANWIMVPFNYKDSTQIPSSIESGKQLQLDLYKQSNNVLKAQITDLVPAQSISPPVSPSLRLAGYDDTRRIPRYDQNRPSGGGSHKIPKVHTGPLGGKYVIKNGKKKYLA